MKAWPLEDRIQCVSVNNDAIDIPRIQESFSNLKSYIKGIASKLETAFASKKTNNTYQAVPQEPKM